MDSDCTSSSVPLPCALCFDVREYPACVCVAVAGELDIATTTEFRRQLQQLVTRGRRIAVDLGGLTFMDARGIGACLAAQRDARTADCDVGFVFAEGNVLRVVQVCELECVLRGWTLEP